MSAPNEVKEKSGANLLLIPLVGAAVIIVLILVINLVLHFSGGSSSVSDEVAAKRELTETVQSSFAQRFAVPATQVSVSLGDEDPLVQYENKRANNVLVVVRLTKEETRTFFANMLDVSKTWLTPADGKLQIGAEFDVPLLGKTGVGANQAISAVEGDVLLTPAAFYLSGLQVPLEEILKIPFIGDWIKEFSAPQTHCIADQAPKGFTVSEARLTGDSLELTFSAKEQSLTLEALQASGSCAE